MSEPVRMSDPTPPPDEAESCFAPVAQRGDPFRMSAGQRAGWIFACAAAAMLHAAGGAYALLRDPPETAIAAEDVGGAMAVEFAELPMSIDAQDGESADSVAAEAAPPAADVDEKLSQKTDTDLPTVESSPYEAPPDLQLAEQKTQKETETPDSESQPTEELKVDQQSPPSEAAIDSTAGGTPSAVEGEAEAAPAEGSVIQAVETPASWQRSLMAHLGRHKRYPKDARSRNIEGDVKLRILIDRSGKVLSSEILQSSGKPAIDAAALDMVARSAPVPALPSSIRAAQVEIVMPL